MKREHCSSFVLSKEFVVDSFKDVEDLLQPVGKSRLHDTISQQLNKLIAEGKLSPGDRLPPERELAERFKVSRNSVRDALRTLEARGLIETRQGDGTYVREMKPARLYTDLVDVLVSGKENIRNVLQARSIIEPQVAYLAAQNAQTADLDRLEHNVIRHEAKAADHDPGVDEDAEFHYLIAVMSGNPFLVSLIEFINKHIERSRDMLLRYDESSTRLGHRAILAALRAHDADAARSAMAQHIAEVMQAHELIG